LDAVKTQKLVEVAGEFAKMRPNSQKRGSRRPGVQSVSLWRSGAYIIGRQRACRVGRLRAWQN
jgi:hypothetical protein